jgi:VWFA-related protein
VKEIVMAAAMALVLSGQQTAKVPDAPQQQQQQAIPDAPKPQTGFGTIAPGTAPGKGTTPTSNGESGSAPTPTEDPFQPALGTGLGQKPQVPDQEQDTPPEMPANSQEFLKDPTTYTQRIFVNSVEIPFTVKDNKGRLVPGLTYRDVHVYENNVRQKMTVFTVDPYPLSVALVVDQSMPFDVMKRVDNALGALQGAFTPYDEVSVFTYNNGPKMLTDFTGGQSARLTAVVERAKAPGREPMFYDASGGLGAGGIHLNGGAEDHETPLASGGPGSPQGLSNQQVPREVHTLNDAILLAAQTVSKAGRGRRRIVYVISDGKEYGSKAKQKDVIRYLQTNKIEVVATLVGDASVTGMGFIDTIHLPLMMRDNALPVYTKATGGQFFADYRTKAIESSFAKITEEARTQYTVWYNSREPLVDGKFRKVEVRVLRPSLQVIAKDGYYPSPQDSRPPLRPTAAAAPKLQ